VIPSVSDVKHDLRTAVDADGIPLGAVAAPANRRDDGCSQRPSRP